MKKEITITFKSILVLFIYILFTSGAHYLITDTSQLKEEEVEDG